MKAFPRIHSLAAFVVLLATSCLNAQSADETKLLQLQHDWAEARKAQNVAFLEKFYAPDFTVVNLSGIETTRAQDIAMFSSGDLKPDTITDEQMKVRIFGDSAMVTGMEHLHGAYRGRVGGYDLRFTNVYVKTGGEWRLLRHHATQVPTPKQP